MAVLVEGISVLVRIEPIREKFAGGWNRFLRLIPNKTLCYDDKLARVGFMDTASTIEFVDQLESFGLTFLSEGKAVDIVVCDQQNGPTTACDWLQFARVRMGTGKVAMAWWWHRKVGFGLHMPAVGLKLATPPGWRFAGSLSDKYTYVPDSLISNNKH